MRDVAYTLGKTGYGLKVHVVMPSGKSRCGHQVVGATIADVTFDELGQHGKLCSLCESSILYDMVRGKGRRHRQDVRHLISQRRLIERASLGQRK